jgi:hypothetical protein
LSIVRSKGKGSNGEEVAFEEEIILNGMERDESSVGIGGRG